MKRTIFIITIFIFFAAAAGYGQNGIRDFYSPLLLGYGANSSFSLSPSCDTVNPAASGGRQTPAIDFSYISLIGTNQSGLSGHIINLGTSIPSRIGVFSGSGRFISSPFDDFYPGTYGSLNLSFAKDLYRDLYFGFGLGVQAGSDWGLGGDIGFVHTLGPLIRKSPHFLQDFNWGFAITGIGKGYKPEGSDGSYPEVFTPSLGASLTLLKTRPVSFTLAPTVSFPAFQDVRVTAGGEIDIFGLVSLRSAYTFDLQEYRQGTGRELPFTFGLSVHLDPLGKAAGRNDENVPEGQQGLSVDLAGGWFSDSAWGLGIGSTFNLGFYDRTPPVITAGTTPEAISPNYDGINDELTIPITITDERYTMGYKLEIRDTNDSPVRTIRNKEDRPENKGFKNILDRFASKKEGIPLPEYLRWDGKSDEGTVVPDGEYLFVIEAWDDNENIGSIGERNISIDSTYPDIQIEAPYTVFSPNGDGRQDTLIIRQSGSEELKWTGTITGTGGETVREFTWNRQKPPAFEWDGRDSKGILPTDNVYTYTVTATDKGGNTTTETLKNIIINTRPTPVHIYLEYPEFSPNGDGIKDELVLNPDIPVTDGIKNWELIIENTNGETVRSLQGDTSVPSALFWDGKTRGGGPAAEGSYTGTFSVLYTNGNRPEAATPPFTVDITKPKARISLEYPVFSPNSDGSKDTLLIQQETSSEKKWIGTVTDTGGNIIAEYSWSGPALSPFGWDGMDSRGKPAADGTYRYSLSSVDEAGNSGNSETVIFSLDTKETPVQITAALDFFSPNGDGVKDSLTLYPGVSVREGIVSWRITMLDSTGKGIHSFRSGTSGSGSALPESIIWEGKTKEGRAVDGQYSALLEVEYENGNKPTATTGAFTIDTVFPAASALPEFFIFSPDGDGRQDTVTFRQQTSSEELWEGKVFDTEGKELRSMYWIGRAHNFVWDGKDDQGNPVPDGRYGYVLSASDQAGNRTSTEKTTIRVDTKPTPVSLLIDSKAFSPNRDGEKDTITLTPMIEQPSGIDSWKLTIVDSDGRALMTEEGRDSTPENFLFDGRGDNGRLLPEGTYTASLSIVYKKGSNPVAVSPPFNLDVTPPKAVVSPDTPVFSPNGDDKKDIVVFFQEGSREDSWTGMLTTEEGASVRQFFWKEAPQQELAWDGRDMNGKRVPDGVYHYTLSSVDTAGNAGASRRLEITVDTRETPLKLTTDLAAFSPNGDGVQDVIRISPEAGRLDGIEEYSLKIVDERGVEVLVLQGRDRRPAEVAWDGKDSAGNMAEDGNYRGELTMLYLNGNNPSAQTPLFQLDTTGPEITLSYDYLLFSPDGDGKKDTFTVKQSSTREELWTAKILNTAGKAVRTMTWTGNAPTMVWNGSDDSGNIAANGSYTYVIESRDRGGNRVKKEIAGIGVDSRSTPVYITASSPDFSPNGDGEKDTLTLTPYVELKEGISEWSIEMIHPEKGVEKRFTGSGTPPASLVWNGMGEYTPAADGQYRAQFSVIYKKGNTPGASVEFALDTEPPEVALSIGPEPFSPDNDGVDDELYIDMEVEDTSDINSWKIEIIDPAGNIFTSYSGVGKPSRRIIWDGISDRGELVQSAEDYTLVMTIEDSLGNSRDYEKTIPVDVLVIREGNKLKIIISSIIFAPNTADFSGVEEEKSLKNTKTLRRLAQIFRKYSRYRIHIEGYAVMVYWDNPARAEKEQTEELIPLSKARAEAVKDALVELGIDKNRITTEGMGGSRPLVPHSDEENRWKNRRVEFILVK